MFCPKCGTKNKDDSKFCASCGNKLAFSTETANNKNSFNSEFVNPSTNKKNDNLYNYKKNTKAKKFKFTKKQKIIFICIISFIILVVVSCIVISNVFVAPNNARKELESKYKTSFNIAQKQKKDLEKKIGGCEYTLSNVQESLVQDASTLSSLKDILKQVQNDIQNIDINENVPESDSEILSEIDNLSNKTEQLKDNWFKLNNAEAKVYESKNSKSNEGIALTERMNVTGKDDNGYNIQTIVKTTSWIRASDKDLINRAWKSAGGRNDAPAIWNFNKSDEPFNEENSIVLVGSTEFHNKTDGFHITDTNKKNPSIYLTLTDTGFEFKGYTLNYDEKTQNIIAKYATGYSTTGGDNTEYGKLDSNFIHSGIWGSNYNKFIGADMYKDDWGPVAFMIVLNNVFNPNYPNGNPVINRIEFSFSPSFNKLGENNYIDTKLYKFKPKITW